ncbi:hypothetical protein MPRM_08670 [Mycobacterium parmense]|uniref:Uncharacterized protein n=1 Tax=Mycobacterium parmense TaxID=185642 RepID=A0A7I7YP07_9MYCO|nr:hypothetical protein AWC20_23855 [Mycobacterium parmense]BBZ43586.1 hypothetical protein MPRM_08670 [Mycobacterium parmense]
MPPKRRTQCATRAAPQHSANETATGPCHSRGPAAADATSSAAIHAATTNAGCVPTTLAPRALPAAAATPRRQASTAATRPAATATATAAAPSAPKARPCSVITTTTAATPKGPVPPSRITASARSGGP